MSMIQVIAFDADDTLWENEIFYSRVKDIFTQLFEDEMPSEEITRRLDEIEIRNLRYWGYGIKSFCLSMIETAISLSDGQIEARRLSRVLDEGKRMLENEIQILNQVSETLDTLHLDYDLMLITKGDLFEQDRKIHHSGLIHHFRYIEVVPDKTPQTYRRLLDKYKIPAQAFLMVGNSLRSDILPVLELGCHAVYIPYAGTWEHENNINPGVLERAVFHTLDDFSGLTSLIESISQGE